MREAGSFKLNKALYYNKALYIKLNKDIYSLCRLLKKLETTHVSFNGELVKKWVTSVQRKLYHYKKVGGAISL